ncbi:MAG TPA: ribonuclease H-like YkuK family protein [Thermoclostridium sp.]|nr:ribonuclease H-like YkuK family protein [Thermoclostridium sp.]
MLFFNSTQKDMNFTTVVKMIQKFIDQNPNQKYRLAVGTDSQAKGNYICFATGIHIHRLGQGAWCCVHKRTENKRYSNLREKISKETIITYEMLSVLSEQLLDILCAYTENYKDFDCKIEAHIDIGTKGETRKLIREMVGYFEGSGIDAKIKPDSFVASSYADRCSKSFKVDKIHRKAV